MELALLRMLSKQLDASGSKLCGKRGESKAVYVAPMKALVHEKVKDWGKRFGPLPCPTPTPLSPSTRFGASLGINCVELTGDTDLEPAEIEAADVICTTPEKFGEIDATPTLQIESEFTLLRLSPPKILLSPSLSQMP